MSPTPRNESSNALADMPIWAKFIAYIGIPGALSIFLVYTLATGLVASSQNSAELASEALTLQKSHIQETKEHNDDVLERLDKQLFIQRQMCANSAKTPVQIAKCVE